MKSTSFPKWLPIEIKEFYLENGVKNLFKWQRNIIDQSSESQQNILFSAPTSAGKSIVAEFLALRVAQEGRKVLFILPYISVAKEKLFHLQKCWRRVDITVAGFIGPNSVPPNDWLAAVCTIEKAASLLNRALTDAWCDKIGMVVVDELHMLFDSSRGVNLEFLLCKILYWNRTAAVNPIRVVGMSATVPQIKSLGEWMNSKVFRAEFRPIDLKENVVYNGIVYNSEGEVFGEEIRRLESSRDVSLTLALEGCRRGKKQLLFCSSKADTEKTSLDLAKLLDPLLKSSPILKDVMEKIREGLMAAKKRLDQLGSTDKCLLLSLARGIAFHHAGLTIEERECIEETFRNGHLLVLVCTSTLASGVNLPAETVIIKAQSRGPSALNSTTYRQMIGRAGRMGHSTEGESYLVVKNQEQEAVLKLLSGKEEDRTRSRPDVSKLLLESICTGLTSSAEEMHQLVSFLFDSKSSDVSSSIEKLLKNSFISESCHEKGLNKLVATQLGKATLASSLPPEAALFIFDDLMTASKSICLDTELHMLYLVTPINVSVWQDCDWDHLYALFVQIPPEHRRVGKLVGMSEKYMLDRLQGQWKAHDKRLQVHIRFFSSLALYDLISEVPLNEVSAKYRISRGCLQTLQHQSSTYAAMVVAFCARLGWMYLKSLLDGFAMRLFFGIRSELSELVMIEGIDGHRARVFHEQGLTCLSQLAVCETTKVANVLSLAVPYSSEDENDGKREWLFGCYRMSLNEAAESLRQRARDCLLTRVRDLGLSVSFGQLEKAVFEEKSVAKPQSVTAESSFVDSGVASLPESFVPKKAPTNMISDGTMDKFNITMEELSLLDQEDELVFDNIGKSECADVFSQVDTLEMSLLAVRPPHKKDFYKKLTSVFASEVGASTSFKCSIEDTFQNSIIFTSKQGSVANSARRLSTASVLNQSGNSSFDVFGTPPTANRTTLKHRREASLTGPFSPSTSSPVQKQMRYEYSELNVKNPCRDLKSWNLWRRSIFAFNRIGLSLHVLSGKINTVHILHGDTVFEILISKAQNDDVNGVWTVVPLEQRLDALKTLLGRAETVLSSLSQCFTLYKNFKFRVLKPIIVSILNHILMNGEVDECYLDRRITDLSWDFDPLKYLQGDGSAASAMRAFAIGRVYQDIYPRAIAQSSSEYVSLELDAARVVSEIFYDGVPFDAIGCASAIAKLRKTIENLQSECFVFSKIPFNLDSSREVSNVVFCKLNLVHPGQQTSAKRHLSTSKTILEQISNQHPIVPKILQYRHLNYVISQCLTPLIEAVDKEDQRVRSTWDICTATGRILTSQPNIQNVPKTESSEKFFVRDLFRPREGYVMIGADYSQLELRVLAHLSGDSKLISFLVEERDFFSELSAKWGFTRVAVKQLCYGLIYGMGAKSLAESTKLSMDEAEQLRNNFFAIFPKVKTYIQETKDRANREGYVATLLGHKRLTNCSGKTEDRAREERVVVNYTIQGTASEIFKAAIVQIAKELSDWDARIVMLVHDEVLVEAKGELAEKVAAIVRTCMQNSLADRLKVPMRISLNVARSWAKLK